MKRFSVLFFIIIALLVFIIPTLAQNNPDFILLDDATPAIDVVITLPADTTGTIALNFAMASVSLKDANDTVVFHAADQRLHGIEFNIMPNSGTHTLTIERLPNVTQAYVNVASLIEMTLEGNVVLTDSTALSFNEETSLILNADNPIGTASVTIPPESIGIISALFAGTDAQTTLVDDDGIVVAESIDGHVDGLNFVIDGGVYEFNILSNNLVESVVGVRAISIEDSTFTVVDAPSTTVSNNMIIQNDCEATITESSVNLRSGPGTGYSVLNYAYRNEVLLVGGSNPEQNWIVVGTKDGGSAWLALSATQLSGSCDTLTIFNIPLRDSTPAQIVITVPDNANINSNNNSQYETDDDNHYEHEENEHEEHDDDD